MAAERKKGKQASVVLLFAALAILTSFTRLHSTPAFLAGAAGGALLVIGIFLVAKK